MAYSLRSLPIGVFDSGVGGLTVLRALQARLPHESFVYLGDTARLPYGTKSSETVRRYALQAAQVLVDRGVKMLVIACNTASSVAVEALAEHFEPLPTIGVVEPGAEAACQASSTGRIAVIGTEGTIRGKAYERAIVRRRPEAVVTGRACPLFVALAEEGWTDGPVAEAVARRYLEGLLGPPPGHDTLVLGCTHFPVLGPVLQRVAGEGIRIVDSAATTAAAVALALGQQDLFAQRGAEARVDFLATDGSERFAAVGSRFLERALGPGDVHLVDL